MSAAKHLDPTRLVDRRRRRVAQVDVAAVVARLRVEDMQRLIDQHRNQEEVAS